MDRQQHTVAGVGTFDLIPTGTGIKFRNAGLSFGTAESEPATPVAGQILGVTIVSPVITNPIISSSLVSATASTLALTQALHDGKTVVLNRAAGIAVTLPAATGTGARFRLAVGTALSAATYTVAVASATDYLRGVSITTQDAADTALFFDTADTGTVATESDTITLNGGTQGGVVGTVIELEDIASAVWLVKIQNKASGVEATPFSAAV